MSSKTIHPSDKWSKQIVYQKGFRPPPFNVKVSHGGLSHRKLTTELEDLPENFHYQPSQLTAERNQGQCGSCWAFAITSALADRVFIKTGNNVPLSVQHLLNCVKVFDGTPQVDICDSGNDIGYAMAHLPEDGLIPERIQPYQMINGGKNNNKCQLEKSEESDYQIHLQNQSAYIITDPDGDVTENVRNIKAHIYHEGPVIATMVDVYPDFYDYDGVSVYVPKPNQTSEGGHAIEILGWGKNEEGQEYWICRNSWGSGWPAKHLPGMGRGWFYLALGKNVCGIEKYVFASIPEIKGEEENDNSTDAFLEDNTDYVQPRGKYDIIVTSKSRKWWLLLLIVLLGVIFAFRKQIFS